MLTYTKLNGFRRTRTHSYTGLASHWSETGRSRALIGRRYKSWPLIGRDMFLMCIRAFVCVCVCVCGYKWLSSLKCNGGPKIKFFPYLHYIKQG